MTAARRIATLMALALALVVGAPLPASATYSETVGTSANLATLTVEAPTSVSVSDRCYTTSSNTWGGWGWGTTHSHWYSVTVSWPASNSKGVTGYRVMVHPADGESFEMATTDAATRSVSATVDRSYLELRPRLSVVTLTSYGWTAETPRTAILTC